LLCGQFAGDLNKIFPKKLGIYVLLTRKNRRQIWYAYLAGKQKPLHQPSALRHTFMYGSGKSLLEDVYGELPHGFLGLVKSPSVADLSKAGFRHLYDLLSAGKVNPLQLHGIHSEKGHTYKVLKSLINL